jgi:hypothetical protein
LDPLAADFAEWSAYNYVLGNPVMFIDLDGRNPIRVALKAMKALKKGYKAWKKGDKFDGQEFLKEEGMDIVDGLATVIDPSASYIEKTLAIGELVSGLDLRTNKGQRAKKLWDNVQNRLDKEFEVQDFGNKSTILDKKAVSDYVVTPDGTTVSTDLKKVQDGFDKAGFKQVEKNEANGVYEVPKADGSGTFYSRLQQGKNPRKTDVDGDRVINTRNDGNTRNKQYVNPDGSRIHGAVPKDKRKEIGHIQLEPKKGN